MSYQRILPRDLFNEANLLKCYGRLWLLSEGSSAITIHEPEDAPFDIQQDPGSGALTIQNIDVMIHGDPWTFYRPLNSRRPWPLYAVDPGGRLEIPVFTDDGNFSQEFKNLLHRE